MASNSDRRLSPDYILSPVKEFFGGRIPFDPFTEANNPTGAVAFCSLELPEQRACGWDGGNGLEADWHGYAGTWSQPPFYIMPACVDKAIREARLGADILFLARSDNRTRWHRRLSDNADAHCAINRSVGFIEVCEDGSLKKLSGDFYAYSIFYMGRQRRRFERVFSPLGKVYQGMGPLEVMRQDEMDLGAAQ